eukprot:IDg22511t1
MKLIAEAQRDLLKGAEYEIANTMIDKAAELNLLVVERAHQKSENKKISCIVAINGTIVIAASIDFIVELPQDGGQMTKSKLDV